MGSSSFNYFNPYSQDYLAWTLLTDIWFTVAYSNFSTRDKNVGLKRLKIGWAYLEILGMCTLYSIPKTPHLAYFRATLSWEHDFDTINPIFIFQIISTIWDRKGQFQQFFFKMINQPLVNYGLIDLKLTSCLDFYVMKKPFQILLMQCMYCIFWEYLVRTYKKKKSFLIVKFIPVQNFKPFCSCQ